MAQVGEKFLKRVINPDAQNEEKQKVNYFKLENDKDKTKVSLLLKDIDDINQFTRAVHMFKFPNNQYASKVDCLREEGADISTCPLCVETLKKTNKIFIPLYNHSTKNVEVWERSLNDYYPIIVSFLEEYPNSLQQQIFEVVRHGKKGNPRVFYTVEHAGAEIKDDMTQYFDQRIDLNAYGGPVYSWDEDKMQAMLKSYPDQDRYDDNKKFEQKEMPF